MSGAEVTGRRKGEGDAESDLFEMRRSRSTSGEGDLGLGPSRHTKSSDEDEVIDINHVGFQSHATHDSLRRRLTDFSLRAMKAPARFAGRGGREGEEGEADKERLTARNVVRAQAGNQATLNPLLSSPAEFTLEESYAGEGRRIKLLDETTSESGYETDADAGEGEESGGFSATASGEEDEGDLETTEGATETETEEDAGARGGEPEPEPETWVRSTFKMARLALPYVYMVFISLALAYFLYLIDAQQREMRGLQTRINSLEQACKRKRAEAARMHMY